MSANLPKKPSLEFLKRQAKQLKKGHAAQNPDAIHWLKQLHPKLQNATENEIGAAKITLADVQLVVARAYGFSSWPKLKQYVESISTDEETVVFAFLNTACPAVNVNHRSGDLETAAKILQEHPEVANANIYTAAVLGNAELVKSFLAQSPELANQKGGPRNWEPLFYLCFSRFLRFKPERTPEFVRTAKTLLSNGADPNAFFMAGEEKETALYGAAGVANNAELVKVLLESGADVNDPDAHYHVAEFDNFECFKLFVDHGVDADGQATMLLRKLDFDQIDSVRYLLEIGCDPNAMSMWGKMALHQALMRGRSLPFFELLIEHKADVNAKMADGRSVYALAVRQGRDDVVDLLEKHGVKKELSATDRLLAACVRADAKTAHKIVASQPDILTSLNHEDKSVLAEVATAGKTKAIKLMLELGFEAGHKGNLGATALHWAAWHGWAEVVRLLLDHKAPTDLIDDTYRITALGWAADGSGKCDNPAADYFDVATALLDAGSAVTKVMLEDTQGKMKKLLQQRLESAGSE